MNKVIVKAKKNIAIQKKKYLFLTIITLIGIVSGILFILFISKADKSLVSDELNVFITNIKDNKLNYFSSLINSIFSNFIYFIIIWILGISIIGIPVIVFLLFLKGFIFGFSVSSLIYKFGFKGFLISLGYNLPHNLIMLVLYILISFYAVRFSVKLFRMLFLKENINLRPYFKRYNQVMLICVLISVLCSLFEIFISPILINLFL